ncbi:MAG: response regulator transcription factor [Chloroflexi bacterium]|jgi:NarL family two-component system response regulator LiaR|nr:response regulator transcription factor [Chloroflexota bacterium]
MDPIRILLADDHILVREGTRQILEREPAFHVIAEANNGQEALALVEEWHPDLAILDSSMPLLSGIEATRRIKKVSPQTAVLVLTAYDDARYVAALLEAGAAGYLLKNARSNDLIQAVRRITLGTEAPVKRRRARRSAGMETSA